MNWVSPIKDEETLAKFKEKLREVDDKYYILFEIGVGNWSAASEILKFKNKDIAIRMKLRLISAQRILKEFSRSLRIKGDYPAVYGGKGSRRVSDSGSCQLQRGSFKGAGLPRV